MSDEVLIRLHQVRLRAKQNEIEKRLERVNNVINETQIQIETTSKTLNNVRLTSQLVEFVELNEHYAETLELIAEQAKTDVSILSPLQDAIDMEDSRYKEAMELFAELMDVLFDQIEDTT